VTFTCYQLAPPGAAAASGDLIARLIRKELGVADPGRHVVEVTPWSGWVRYYDKQRLWQDRPVVLPSREQAQTLAETWIKRYAALLTNNPALPSDARGLQLAPARAQPTELSVLANGNGNGYDHWLYRARPVLSLGGDEGSVEVLGSAFEIRIGEGGAVVGFSVRWRALTGSTFRAPKSGPSPRMFDEPDEGDATPPPLVYVLEGEFSPQAYLSPYYLRGTGHEISIASASTASLTIDFYGGNTDEASELTAYVMGGSGDYEIRWGITRAGDPESLREVSEVRRHTEGTVSASTVSVAVGAYLVVIDVRDRQTGATAMTQQYALCGHLLANGQIVNAPGPTTPTVA